MKKCFVLIIMFLSARGIFSQSFAVSPDFTALFRVPAFEKPLLVPLAAETINGEKPMPQWIKDLRRGEIVAFGSVPLTIFWTSFLLDLYRCAVHNWDTRYAPWPIKSAGAVDMTDGEVKMMFTIAISASLTIAVVDQIIIRAKRAKSRRNEPFNEIIIKREPQE